MSETEQGGIESLRYQVKKWNKLASKHLPETKSDRDDVDAIDKKIELLQEQLSTCRGELVASRNATEHYEKGAMSEFELKLKAEAERDEVKTGCHSVELARVIAEERADAAEAENSRLIEALEIIKLQVSTGATVSNNWIYIQCDKAIKNDLPEFNRIGTVKTKITGTKEMKPIKDNE